MNDADAILVRAWLLAVEDATDEVYDEFERLLPALIEAGYAESDGEVWNFTRAGIARANELAPDPDGKGLRGA